MDQNYEKILMKAYEEMNNINLELSNEFKFAEDEVEESVYMGLK